MSKGLDNGYEFNITCKKCNSQNIDAEELDGYIKLICLDCDKLKHYDDEIEKIEGLNRDNFIQNILLNKNKNILKESFNSIVIDSEKALVVINKIKLILDDPKNNIRKEELTVVYSDSPFKYEVFQLCEKLKGLKVIDGVYGKSFRLVTYCNPLLEKRWNSYELESYCYDLELNDNNKVSIDSIERYDNDCLFISEEIDSYIEILTEYIEKLKNLIVSLK